MGKVILSGVSKGMTKPVSGTPISQLAVGSIVNLNEGSSLAEFYIAKHDYESGLNGTGRTLLVRKYCYDNRVWNSSNVNAYDSSDIDSWMNSSYKSLFEEKVQNAMGATKFYYTPGNGKTTVTTLERAIFLLSGTEVGLSNSKMNTEGSKLPIFGSVQSRIAYFNGNAVFWLLRSPFTSNTTTVSGVQNTGYLNGPNANDSSHYSRPAFTLPSDKSLLQDDGTIGIRGW